MLPTRLDSELFDRLAERTGNDLISIVIPTHEKGRREIAQDAIRLKNALGEVDARLEELGWRTRDRTDRLSRAHALFDDQEFAEHQSAGLAVYIDEDGDTIPIALSHEPRASCYILPVFGVRPLVTGLDASSYTVLVATRGAVRLYELTGTELTPVDADLPGSFEDVNWFVDRETQRQRHPDRVGADRNRHGHRASGATDEDTLRFVRAIADAMPDGDNGTPVIVLGDDRLVADLRAHVRGESTSPKNSGIIDPDSTSEVRETARIAVTDIERRHHDELVQELEQRIGTGRATTSVTEALPAAISGRLAEIAIRPDADPVWGRFDRTRFDVEISDEPRPGDVDLLDRVVVEGRRTGADIHALTDHVAGSALAASLRF